MDGHPVQENTTGGKQNVRNKNIRCAVTNYTRVLVYELRLECIIGVSMISNIKASIEFEFEDYLSRLLIFNIVCLYCCKLMSCLISYT